MDTSHKSEVAFVLKEVFLLRGVWENFRALWLWSWLLHWGLYLYLLATLFAVVEVLLPADASFRMLHAAVLYGYRLACPLGLTGAFGLLVMRSRHPRVRAFTTRIGIFDLLLLGSIFATGMLLLTTGSAGLDSMVRDLVRFPAILGNHPSVLASSRRLGCLFPGLLSLHPHDARVHEVLHVAPACAGTTHRLHTIRVPRKRLRSTCNAKRPGRRRTLRQAAQQHGRKWLRIRTETERGNVLKLSDIATQPGQLSEVPPQRLMPLPAPYDDIAKLPPRKVLNQKVLDRIDTSLDGFSALGLSRPQTPEEEQQFVERFLSGLEKLLSEDNNWTFLEQLRLSLDHCARCQTCVEACPIYTASGHDEVYRPTFRSEVFRRLVNEYAKPGGRSAGMAQGRTYRAECGHARPAARIRLPLHALPSLRAGLPHGCGQRAADA